MRPLLLLSFAFALSPVLRAADDVSAEIAPLIEGKPVPGLAVAAVLDGKIIATGATGIRKLGDPAKVTVADQFHLGSCTKSMTATLAAMIVADGKVKWTTTAAEVFPGLAIDPGFRKATLREFLSNSGGVATEVPPALWNDLRIQNRSEPQQRKQLLEATLKAPPAYVPGEGWAYSNTGFSIGGAMLEKVTGKPYDRLLTERLFKPLGMTSSGFGPAATNGKVAQPYGHHLVDGQLVPVDPFPDGDNPPAITPAGRVHASIEDFARFADFHLGRKTKPLTGEQIAFLHEIVPPSKDYAMGWIRTERPWAGGTALTHNGTNTMFFAVMWLAPAKNFAVVAACNSGEGAAVCDAAVSQLIGKYCPK
ncbi:MAG: penicillin-binding protein beta-lactamase class [Akkermansiaceae bacterium]|nr:penicillin-binding protein beta-lactamase class [Akkermansiaceae bacterium]